MAGRTRKLSHVFAHLFARKVRIGFLIATLNVINHAFKWNVNIPHAAKVVFIMEMESGFAIAIKHLSLLFGRQFLKWNIHINIC